MNQPTQAHALPEWAKKIRLLRKKLGLNQKDFGAKFGVTAMAVSYWETGENSPNADVLMTVLTELGALTR